MSITFRRTERGITIRATGGDDCRGVFEAMTRAGPDKQVADWNNAVNVGQEVDYRSDPDAAPQQFKTRCHADVLSGHTAVVWLEGKSGCVSLESLTVVPVEGGAA